MKMLHVANQAANTDIWSEVFRRALAEMGELEVVADGKTMDQAQLLGRMRQADVLLTSWGSAAIPVELAASPGRVRYVCNVTGSVRGCVPGEIIDAGIAVSNWGDAPAHGIAEGAVCLLLAALKDLHAQIQQVRRGEWALSAGHSGGTLARLNVGIYGFGVIGRRFAELLQPFGCVMRVFDPFTNEFPNHVTRVASLTELFSTSDAVAIHAGLTEQTRGSVTGELLALLPDHAVIVNTARGDIIDQAALFKELESGRLRAGLDVLATPERLPADHPARNWENLILSCHAISRGWPSDGKRQQGLLPIHEICLDNLRRFSTGQPLRFVMDRQRFDLST